MKNWNMSVNIANLPLRCIALPGKVSDCTTRDPEKKIMDNSIEIISHPFVHDK